eukprot:EG_transcript_19594
MCVLPLLYLLLFLAFLCHSSKVPANTILRGWQPHKHLVKEADKKGKLRRWFNAVAMPSVVPWFNNTIFLTLSNKGYLDFLNNSLLHFARVFPGRRFFVVCYDQETFDWCDTQPVAFCVLSSGFGTYCKQAPQETKAYLEYYTNAFRITQICRLAVIHYMLREGWNVFWLDPDSALLRDPFQVMPPGHEWVGACHPADQKLMGPMRSKVHRNIGVMWVRSGLATKRAQRLLLLRMYYTREGRRAHDQYLFNDFYTDHRVRTLCLPYTADGLSCNEAHWKPYWPGTKFFNVHAACAPKGDRQKKQNKRAWLQAHSAWLSSN